MRTAINAAIIRRKRILLVRKKNTWILPGGKPNKGEHEVDCLFREMNEELPGLRLTITGYYSEFEGVTPHKGDVLEARVYFAEAVGNTSTTSHEILESARVSYENANAKYQVSDITKKVLDGLRQSNYL